ncbi:MAG: SsrA-binding protein SmpB [Mariprofundales bacterium]
MAMINRRAWYEYDVIEEFEAGIILTGAEVKSLRAGQGNLAEAHCIIRHEEAFLLSCHISHYKPAAMQDHEPTRTRKLLLHKHEIKRLLGKLKEKGFTLIPLKMYFNEKNRAKMRIGLARGKKMYDKRRTIKDRDVKRDLQRQFKLNG